MSDALRNALELYASSYDTMDHIRDGRVQARDVAYDIRRNMIPAALAALPEQRPQAPEPVAWLIVGPVSRTLTEDGPMATKHSEAGYKVTPLIAQVRSAQERVAAWSPEKRANVQLEGERAVKQGAPAAPADLTDEQIDAMVDAWFDCYPVHGDNFRPRMRLAIDAGRAALASPAAPRNDLDHPAQADDEGKAP